MTTTDLTTPSSRAAGQATMVEQSRAIAEVRGAIMVAQDCPRDPVIARAQMLDSCNQTYLAERAFFRFPRGKKQNPVTGKWEENILSGPSIHLARELARLWGNIQYGVKEMRRDDIAGESEMLAFAWDVQTNTRIETTFIVPHRRDTKTGTQLLTDMRDVYENNANQGARRVRECVFAVLPPWFTEAAKAACVKTNADGGGKPLVERISEALDRFAEMRVTTAQLQTKVGAPVGQWTGQHLATLIVVYRSLANGETTVDSEFPPEVLHTDDIDPAAPAPGPAPQPLREQVTGQLAALNFGEPGGITLDNVGALIDRPDLDHIDHLTMPETVLLIGILGDLLHDDEPLKALDATLLAATENKDTDPS
jgi:hypothetical protein